MKKPSVRQEKQLSREDISLRVQRAVQEGKLHHSILSRLDVRFAEALVRIPEEVAQAYGIPRQFSETRSSPDRTSKTEKKVSTPGLRKRKEILRKQVQFANSPPADSYLSEFEALTTDPSLTDEEEKLLKEIYGFFVVEPVLEGSAYFKRESEILAKIATFRKCQSSHTSVPKPDFFWEYPRTSAGISKKRWHSPPNTAASAKMGRKGRLSSVE